MRWLVLVSLGFGHLAVESQPARAQTVTHPYILIDDAALDSLYARTHLTGEPSGWTRSQQVSMLAYRSIIEACEFLCDLPPWSAVWRTQGEILASTMTLALGHELRQREGDPGYDSEYYTCLQEAIAYARTNGYPYPTGGSGFRDLIWAEWLASLAIAWDWTDFHSTWPDLKPWMIALIESIVEDSLWEWYDGRNDNNHVALHFGARGLAMLAMYPEFTPTEWTTTWADTLSQAVERVQDYLDASYQVDGASNEGVMYSQYALSIALPFALATDRDAAIPGSPVNVVDSPAYLAARWLLYEQRPYDRFGGTPLNDTFEPPEDLNCRTWRSWPWLMAVRASTRPTAARQLFHVTYPPNTWVDALEEDFTPGSGTNDPAGIPFSALDGYYYNERRFGAVPILLSYPVDGTSESEFVEGTELPIRAAFRGRGIAYWRESLFSTDANGALVEDPDAMLFTFEARNRALYNPSGLWYGHAQHDINHFTLFAYGSPLFYDTGPTGYAANDVSHHNVCQMSVDNNWQDYPGPTREGRLVFATLSDDEAPSIFLGNSDANWEELVTYANRTMFLLPREGGGKPYLLMHDDMEFPGTSERPVRWWWHSDNGSGSQDCSFTHEGGSAVTLRKGDAAALVTVLNPEVSDINQEYWTPPVGSGAFPHRRAWLDFASASNADFISLIEVAPNTESCSTPLTATVVPDTVSVTRGRWLYALQDGDYVDLVLVRRAGDSAMISLAYGDHQLETNAQYAVLRFDVGSTDWADIRACAMVNGTECYYDDLPVVLLDVSGSPEVAASASAGMVSIDNGPQTTVTGYMIGPFIPSQARVNGVTQAVTMLNCPHPLQCTFPGAIGRSPKNVALADMGYKYKAQTTLRRWDGAAVSGWPADQVVLSVATCANDFDYAAADANSDASGNVVWINALNNGGACSVSPDWAVEIAIDYLDTGVRHAVRRYAEIRSPDQDGDGDLDSYDGSVYYSAVANKGPLYQGDLNCDGAITVTDTSWWQQHSTVR